MAIVPPGNKQIGEFATIAVATPADNTTGLINWGVNNIALTYNQAVTTVPSKVNWVQLFEFATIAVATPIATQLTCYGGLATAVVQYLQETVYYNNVIATTALVDSGEELQLSPLLNTMIGEFSTVAVAELNPDILQASCSSVQAFVLVQPYIPRKELTTFNIEYAEDAQFNIKTNQ